MSRTVLIGAGGFIGMALARACEGGNVLPVTSMQCDLTRPDAGSTLRSILRSSDRVVMLSALTPDKGKDAGTLMKNLAMAKAVGECIEAQGCGHLIYMSSDAVYDDSQTPFRETTPCFSSNLYGHMHIGREIILREACAKARTPFLALRPCAVYGAGDTHNSYGPNRFIRSALKEKAIKLIGAGEEVRDHLLVDDLARFVHRCLEKQQVGVMNVATGRAVPFAEVAEQVARLAGKGVKIEASPRSSAVTYRHFDLTAFAASFPDFRFTALADGLKRTLDLMGAQA